MLKKLLLFCGLAYPAAATDIIIGHAEIRGSLDKSIIRSTIKQTLPALRFCYEQQLVKAPTLTGELTVHFTVNALTGNVGLAFIEESTLNPALEACVSQTFVRLRFPAVQDGGKVEVYYPLSFQPAKEE